MTEEEKENIISLVSSYLGDEEIARKWFENFNKKLGCKPSEASYKGVLEYLRRFVIGGM